MKVKAISRGSYWDDSGKLVGFEKSVIEDVPDEKFLHLGGYAATNVLYDACEAAWTLMGLTREYEIAEEGLAKDIPYLEKPFETVEEMREFLSRPEVIAEFED